MAERMEYAAAPARTRVGLPMLPDGTRDHPLLLRLPSIPSDASDANAAAGAQGACNNGCVDCLTRPIRAPHADPDRAEVEGRHVVIRDREPTLRRDLPAIVAAIHARKPASIAVLTNG